MERGAPACMHACMRLATACSAAAEAPGPVSPSEQRAPDTGLKRCRMTLGSCTTGSSPASSATTACATRAMMPDLRARESFIQHASCAACAST